MVCDDDDRNPYECVFIAFGGDDRNPYELMWFLALMLGTLMNSYGF